MTEETEYEALKRSIDEGKRSMGHLPSVKRVLDAARAHLETLPKPVERPAWRISYLHAAFGGLRGCTIIQSRPLYSYAEMQNEYRRLEADINCRDLRIHNPDGSTT